MKRLGIPGLLLVILSANLKDRIQSVVINIIIIKSLVQRILSRVVCRKGVSSAPRSFSSILTIFAYLLT